MPSKPKPIEAFNPDGTLFKRYDTVRAAAAELNIDPMKIWLCARGKQKTAGGYHWRWAVETVQIATEVEPLPAGAEIPDPGWDFNLPDPRKPVIAHNAEDGSIFGVYCSEAEAARQVGVASSTISNAVNGKTKLSAGMLWSFVSVEDAKKAQRVLIEREKAAKKRDSAAEVAKVLAKWVYPTPDKRKAVEVYNQDGTLYGVYESRIEAAKHTGVPKTTVINGIKSGRVVGGFLFKNATMDIDLDHLPPKHSAPAETPPLPISGKECRLSTPKTEESMPDNVACQNDALSIRIDTLGPYLSEGPAGQYFLFLTERLMIWGGGEFSKNITDSAWYAPQELVKAKVFNSEDEFLEEWMKPDSFLRPYCKMRVVDIDPFGEDEERRLFINWKKDHEKVRFDFNTTGPWWFLHALAKERDAERKRRSK